jgi:hypothetical protein
MSPHRGTVASDQLDASSKHATQSPERAEAPADLPRASRDTLHASPVLGSIVPRHDWRPSDRCDVVAYLSSMAPDQRCQVDIIAIAASDHGRRRVDRREAMTARRLISGDHGMVDRDIALMVAHQPSLAADHAQVAQAIHLATPVHAMAAPNHR